MLAMVLTELNETMSKVNLTNELITEIRETVFGPCTVMYEAMTNKEIVEDLENYLNENRVFIRGEKKAIYSPSLTITTFKSWLLLRREIELMDAYPEHPFDKTDEQIKKEIKGRKELAARLTTNILLLIKKLRAENI